MVSAPPRPRAPSRGVARRRVAGPAATDPRARLVSPADLGEIEISRWRELAEDASEPNPFFEPEFVLPAATHLGQEVGLLVAEDEQGWCGCLPVQSVADAASWKYVPARGLVAWTHLYCFLGTPLLRRESEVKAARALIERGAEGGFLGIDLLGSSGPVAAALIEAHGSDHPLVTFTRSERAALRRGADGWDLRLGSKRRRELGRQRRRLAEEAGADLRTADRAGDPAAVERFLDLEASGWKASEGTALRSDPAHADFFRRACRSFADRGRLQLLSLEAGDATVAMLCSLISADAAFQFKIAFDEGSARFGPGIQIEADAVEMMDAALPAVRTIDSCADPGNQMANRLFPERTQLQRVAIPDGFSGRRNLAFMRAALKARNAIRRSR
ncbi:MAG: GNAT family N-acetyltransferase [Solirubrobacterales bacterium]